MSGRGVQTSRLVGFSIHRTKIVAGIISLVVNATLFLHLLTGDGSLRADTTPVRVLGVTMLPVTASRIKGGELAAFTPSAGASRLLPQAFLLDPESTYFPPSALTQKPLVKVDLPVDFALRAPQLPTEDLILQLLINASGEIDRVVPENAQLPDEVLQALFEAFQNVQFHPGEINGTPVNSRLKISVHLDDSVEERVLAKDVKRETQ
jgi:hypothetical protein